MRKKELIKQLIDLVYQFDESLPGGSELTMRDFSDFLRVSVAEPGENEQMVVPISKHISLLHRYSKSYIKKILKGSLLQTVDEYTYLAGLYQVESLTKTELNNLNAMEKTSGNEVIKRLVKSQLIGQRRDMNDKRSMRVFLTDKGRKELEKLFPELWKSAVLLTSVLSAAEKSQLNDTLAKLCTFHSGLFVYEKDASVEELLNGQPGHENRRDE